MGGSNKMAVEDKNEKEEKGKKGEKGNEEGTENDEEDVSKERLAELGINNEKSLYRSLQRSGTSILRKNKLVQFKQKQDGRKQRKQQLRINRAKEAHKKRKGRQ